MDDLENSQVVAQDDTTELQVEEEVVEQQKETKKSDSVVKLLADRNKEKNARKAAEEKLAQLEPLAQKVAEMEEMIAKQTLDQEAKVEKTEFYANNPLAKQLEAQTEEIRQKNWLSYEQAFKLAAAEHNPSLLMDEQFRNKATSTNNLNWVAKEQAIDKENLTTDDAKQMSAEEFLKWSNEMAAKDRGSRWFTN